MRGRLFLYTIIFTLFIAPALAQNGEVYHLKLLAVQELAGNYSGSEADLFLEIKEGSGRVFLETFPLTKMDTQISTRFAKEIACSHFKMDCRQYDFIFTIKSNSNIIGGPSAGAAIAALTTIAVLDLNYENDIAITGTINSGGIIGPVGGVKEKLEAASKAGLKKVLVAKGTALQYSSVVGSDEGDAANTTEDTIENDGTSEPNTPLDIIQYAKENLSLQVMEVVTLDDVIFELTGVNLNNKKIDVEENMDYQKIMQGLQKVLCSRSKQIEKDIHAGGIFLERNFSESVEMRKGQALNATKKNDFYSAASYCFSNNIQMKIYFYQEKKLSDTLVERMFLELEKKTLALERKLKREKIDTISDLQTLMVVQERVSNVKEQIAKYREANPTTDSYNLLAYAEERFFSALSWMQFFDMEGKRFIMDNEQLRHSCLQKISESEERYQYVTLFIGEGYVSHIDLKISTAKQASENQEYALCLIAAAQAKAEANAVLSSLGLSDEVFDEFLDSKIAAVERVIAENSVEGVFPILGYSYYQYAISLREEQKYTTLVFLEYALEMSDLGIYFPEENSYLQPINQLDEKWIFIGEGFIAGVVLTLIVLWMRNDLLWRKLKNSGKRKRGIRKRK